MNPRQQTTINATADYIEEVFRGEGSGHDWWHIDRVRQTALAIVAHTDGDPYIVELTTLLHDLSDEKFNESQAAGLKKVTDWLTKQHVPQAEQDQVVAIITNMSYKGGTQNDAPLSLEGQIVQDADRLDAIGAIGIARVMAYSGHVTRPIHDPAMQPRENLTASEYRAGNDTAIMHFYEKLLKVKDLMNTDYAKELAKGRHAFLEAYLDQFYAEWRAER